MAAWCKLSIIVHISALHAVLYIQYVCIYKVKKIIVILQV